MKTLIDLWLKELKTPRSVLELYCGSGNFTELFVHAGIPQIVAVEVVQQALTTLSQRWPQVQTECWDLSKKQNFAILGRKYRDSEILFLDPGRAGAPGVELLLPRLQNLKSIFYVSCDLATGIRDLCALKDQGWKLLRLQPFDLFPHTPHIELVAQLVPVSSRSSSRPVDP